MKNCEYRAIPAYLSNLKPPKDVNDKFFTAYFWKQLMICIAMWELYFLVGVGIGSCTVVIAQMKQEAKSEDVISDEMISWITSVFSIVSSPSVLLWTTIARYFGRRTCFTISWILELISYIVFYFSESTTGILVSQVANGMVVASCYSNSLIGISEYVSPVYRGMALSIKSASLFWGIWTANAIGTFMHWRNIPFFALLIFPVFLTTYFWPESPMWLAEKGRFEESIKAHRWLKGRGLIVHKELEQIISEQEAIYKKSDANTSKQNISKILRNYYSIITKRNFYLPFVIANLGLLLVNFSGKYIISLYAIEFLKKISSDKAIVYNTMLILDGITVCGMYIGSVLSKFFNRRTLLFSTASVSILCMYILAAYFYLIHLEIIVEQVVIVVILLVVYSISLSCGPMIMSSSIIGEVIPAKSKSLFMNLTLITFYSISSVTLKTAPLLFSKLKLYGSFLYFGVICTLTTFALYKYLPECKDKTLQEIQDSFTGKYARDSVEGDANLKEDYNEHEQKEDTRV